jgi:uncharacterized protein YdcH (DUF465 family)
MTNMYQVAPVTCPNCRNRYTTPVLTIVDVGQNPQLKPLFLSGQVNVAVCPQCGHAGMLSAPIVYHDPAKELFLTYAPGALGVADLEQQRLLGELTNRVIQALPPEQRKGYLLRPQSFLRLEGMIETILQADGITPEMLAAQRARAELLDRLLRASSKEARRVIAQENDALVDYDLFQLLTMNIELAEAGNQTQAQQELLRLRQQLLEWTTLGRETAAREQAIRSLGNEITREGLLEKVIEAALAGEQVQVETMVTMARPAIDYLFYQQLSGRIEAAEQAGDQGKAKTLRDLRSQILDLTSQIDAEIQAAADEAAALIEQMLQSEDPEAAVRADPAQLDGFFMSVLASKLAEAERAGQTERVEKLRRISEAVVSLIVESQPPEMQFINALLSAKYPDGTRALLEENREQVTDHLVELMGLVGEELATTGRAQVASRLAQIRAQAEILLRQAS